MLSGFVQSEAGARNHFRNSWLFKCNLCQLDSQFDLFDGVLCNWPAGWNSKEHVYDLLKSICGGQ